MRRSRYRIGGGGGDGLRRPLGPSCGQLYPSRDEASGGSARFDVLNQGQHYRIAELNLLAAIVIC